MFPWVKLPTWGIEPIPLRDRTLRGIEYFVLWSSLGVGLLVFSAGSLLTTTPFAYAIAAIIVGSVAGSLLLALAGGIGSGHAVPSIVSTRPSFGLYGASIPAILNVMQLVGWTVFEIMIMSKATEILAGNRISYSTWTLIFGASVILFGLVGPLTVIRQWLEKFAVWMVYAASILIIINLLSSGHFSKLPSMSGGSGMSFFPALDIVIALPVSWMPLVADYNRFSRNNKGAFIGTFIGFAITNILFYFGGLLVNSSDTIAIIVSIQSMFFGLLLFMFILHEITNAFADIYSSAISSQSVFHKVNQRYLIIGFTVLSTILAVIIPISRYETFILLIGAVFVPLFGVVLTDYYIINRRRYTREMMYGKHLLLGVPAILSWLVGVLLYYVLSSLSPIYIFQWPQIGATIPSFIGSSLLYLGLIKAKQYRIGKIGQKHSRN